MTVDSPDESLSFSVAEFAAVADPYDYMVRCGFGDQEPRFPETELEKLSFSFKMLDEVRQAFAFAIAERFGSTQFFDAAIEYLHSHDSSVRLAAYNAVRSMTNNSLSEARRRAFNEALRSTPESTFLSPL